MISNEFCGDFHIYTQESKIWYLLHYFLIILDYHSSFIWVDINTSEIYKQYTDYLYDSYNTNNYEKLNSYSLCIQCMLLTINDSQTLYYFHVFDSLSDPKTSCSFFTQSHSIHLPLWSVFILISHKPPKRTNLFWESTMSTMVRTSSCSSTNRQKWVLNCFVCARITFLWMIWISWYALVMSLFVYLYRELDLFFFIS